MVTSPTRENNILDLVFTNVPFLVQNASFLPGQSDHDMVSEEILISHVRMKPKNINLKIFFYKKLKFDSINEDLAEYYASISKPDVNHGLFVFLFFERIFCIGQFSL